MRQMERNDWSDGERRGVPIAIRFEGIVPLDDIVYYIRSCGQHVAEELQEPGRCEVHASRVSQWRGKRRFEVRIELIDRRFCVQARSEDDDLYVAIWRGFDATLRELVRARAGVESTSGRGAAGRSRSAPAAATLDRDAADSGE